MQQVVYVVILEWEDRGDRDFAYQIHDNLEKAQETLEKWKQEELANSWINSVEDIENLENYEDTLDYFDCCQYDRRTTIWIDEREVN